MVARGVQLRTGNAQVEELKLKILEILHREGKALVALNTMLYADTVNEQLVAAQTDDSGTECQSVDLEGCDDQSSGDRS